jgi:hypothetical protein
MPSVGKRPIHMWPVEPLTPSALLAWATQPSSIILITNSCRPKTLSRTPR